MAEGEWSIVGFLRGILAGVTKRANLVVALTVLVSGVVAISIFANGTAVTAGIGSLLALGIFGLWQISDRDRDGIRLREKELYYKNLNESRQDLESGTGKG